MKVLRGGSRPAALPRSLEGTLPDMFIIISPRGQFITAGPKKMLLTINTFTVHKL